MGLVQSPPRRGGEVRVDGVEEIIDSLAKLRHITWKKLVGQIFRPGALPRMPVTSFAHFHQPLPPDAAPSDLLCIVSSTQLLSQSVSFIPQERVGSRVCVQGMISALYQVPKLICYPRFVIGASFHRFLRHLPVYQAF